MGEGNGGPVSSSSARPADRGLPSAELARATYDMQRPRDHVSTEVLIVSKSRAQDERVSSGVDQRRCL